MKQLILISDMEGASGIFDSNGDELLTGTEKWEDYGRDKMTSDVRAVCEAANEAGVDEILYYDSHFAGTPGFNVRLEELPANVRVFDVPDRCFFWRRIRGQALLKPYGIITVGQHSRLGEDHAYFPHTIQSPPIKGYWLNDRHIAEIGSSVLQFHGTKYIANIGCAASQREARELTSTVHHISVKDKKNGWEPGVKETFSIIKEGVLRALDDYDNLEEVSLKGPYRFRLELCDGFYFERPEAFSWRGSFSNQEARWEAPSFEIGSELFHYVRECIRKAPSQ
ncbi:M55 family metallopeptidase [Gorillibacterium sp. CAU 1737]|uniref:M55 family metallopeptidase n=1 Tax=Gorillibacterium sp. CAU 1737 TaxID=3140362 RepID=UPI0032613A5E